MTISALIKKKREAVSVGQCVF